MSFIEAEKIKEADKKRQKEEFVQCVFLLPDKDDSWSKHKVFGDKLFIEAFFYSVSTFHIFDMYQSVQDYRNIAIAMIHSPIPRSSKVVADEDLIRSLNKLSSVELKVSENLTPVQEYIRSTDLNAEYVFSSKTAMVAFHAACLGYAVYQRYPTIDFFGNIFDVVCQINGFFTNYAFRDFFNASESVGLDNKEWFDLEIKKSIIKANTVMLSDNDKYTLFNAELLSQQIMSAKDFNRVYRHFMLSTFVNSFENREKLKAYVVAAYSRTTISYNSDVTSFRDEIAKKVKKLDENSGAKTAETVVSKERIKYGEFIHKEYRDDEEETVETYYYPLTKKNLEQVDQMFKDFPNFEKPLAFIRRYVLVNLISGGPFHFPPICVKGPGGTGKSHFSQALKKALDASTIDIHASQVTCGSILAGLQRTWSGAKSGIITEKMANSQIVNPLVIFEELSALALAGSHGIDPFVALQRMLDPNEAARFIDGFTLQNVDISKLNWIFSTNNTNNLTDWFKQRVEFFNIEPISESDYPKIVNSLYRDAIDELNLGQVISKDLNDLSKQMLLKKMKKGTDFRKFKSLVKDSITAYCEKNIEQLIASPAGEMRHVDLEYFK